MTTCTSTMKSCRMFECKTCNRQFPSFQALGGHRASHRKPRHTGFIETQAPVEPTKARVHECSICGVEFALGQALGGHMRRHRTDSGNNDNVRKQVEWGLNLDLNLAPPGEEAEVQAEAEAAREWVCAKQEEDGIDLELHLELDLAEKVRFVEWL